MWAALQGDFYQIRRYTAHGSRVEAPYLSPFYSPLLYDLSPQAMFKETRPSWWPAGLPFSAAILVLWGPALFRLTCYYSHRLARRSLAGGKSRSAWLWPAHRLMLGVAVVFLISLWWDTIQAVACWPTDKAGKLLSPEPEERVYHFGMGLGSVIMLVNVILLTAYTFTCTLTTQVAQDRPASGPPGSSAGSRTLLSRRHMLWAWLSLFSVAFADLYIRLCAGGTWRDPRFF
jgi:hypothetical protein